MADLIPQQNSNLGSTLTGAANLANLFLPSNQSTTSGGTSTVADNRSSTTSNSGGTTTSTTQQSVAPGAVDAVIKSIMEGTNGLAAVSSGQRTAGLYGSSTNQLLTNDLVARAAGEAAKLNQSTTQTTVTPQTSQTTQNSGGQTTTSNQTQNTVKQAPVSGSVAGGAAGILGALQLIPKDIKDSVLSGLGIKVGGKTGAAGTTGANGSASADLAGGDSSFADYGANTAANEAALGGVGTSGSAGQTVAGVGSDFTDQFLGSSGSNIDLSSAAGADQDIGGYSLAGVDNSAVSSGGGTDFSGVGDTISSGLGDVGNALGGFLSGIGDTASSVGSDIGNWFSDFDFSFADGGAVSVDGIRQKMTDHVTKKMADGGGIGAPGDTRYGNSVPAAPTNQRGTENIFDRTNRTRETNAGLREADPQVMQQGLVPRTPQERQSVFSLIDTIPQLLNSLLGSDNPKPQGKADGGRINSYANGGTVTDVPIKRMANGGSVASAESDPVYDLSNVSYLANTGLTAKGPDLVKTLGAQGNDQTISRMIQSAIRPTGQSDNAPTDRNDELQGISGDNRLSRTAALLRVRDQSTQGPDQEAAAGNPGVSVGEGIGSVGGIANAIGVSPAVGQAGISGLTSLAGLVAPGLAGLANAPNNNAAVSAMAVAGIGMANPIAGLIASIVLNIINQQNAAAAGGGSGGVSGSSQGEGNTTATVSVGESTAVDADGNSVDGVSGGNAPGVSGTSTSTGIGDAGDSGSSGSSASAGVGADGSSGADGGSSAGGDGGGGGGDGGSYADGGSAVPGIRVANARANPATTADKIPAMLSEGEYVLSADTVAALGIPMLDKLQEMYHVPADQQRNSGFSAPAGRK
jgi:hypothetical protein